jgi:lactate dehydrogenase-like 2-hydroxyacid dehydrogenase
VFAHEPHVPEALFGLPNVLMTPHIGTATRETRQDMADLVLANLDAHFAGRTLPTAVV